MTAITIPQSYKLHKNFTQETSLYVSTGGITVMGNRIQSWWAGGGAQAMCRIYSRVNRRRTGEQGGQNFHCEENLTKCLVTEFLVKKFIVVYQPPQSDICLSDGNECHSKYTPTSDPLEALISAHKSILDASVIALPYCWHVLHTRRTKTNTSTFNVLFCTIYVQEYYT